MIAEANDERLNRGATLPPPMHGGLSATPAMRMMMVWNLRTQVMERQLATCWGIDGR